MACSTAYSIYTLFVLLISNDRLLPPLGPRGDHLSAQGFIHDMFMRGIPPEIRDRCYCHFTCATDTENIMRVFDDVKNNTLSSHIDEFSGTM